MIVRDFTSLKLSQRRDGELGKRPFTRHSSSKLPNHIFKPKMKLSLENSIAYLGRTIWPTGQDIPRHRQHAQGTNTTLLTIASLRRTKTISHTSGVCHRKTPIQRYMYPSYENGIRCKVNPSRRKAQRTNSIPDLVTTIFPYDSSARIEMDILRLIRGTAS